MAKDFKPGSDMSQKIVADVRGDTASDAVNGLSCSNGVDLNVCDVSKADNAKGGGTKLASYDVPPPNDYQHANLLDTPPAIIQEVPADRDPTQWKESIDGLIESAAALAEAKREAEENEARINALNESTTGSTS